MCLLLLFEQEASQFVYFGYAVVTIRRYGSHSFACEISAKNLFETETVRFQRTLIHACYGADFPR